jgi:hypothetical protein
MIAYHFETYFIHRGFSLTGISSLAELATE